MRSIALRGEIISDENAYFFTSDLGCDYIISLNESIKHTLSMLQSKSVQIKGTVNGSKLHIQSVKELRSSNSNHY